MSFKIVLVHMTIEFHKIALEFQSRIPRFRGVQIWKIFEKKFQDVKSQDSSHNEFPKFILEIFISQELRPQCERA